MLAVGVLGVMVLDVAKTPTQQHPANTDMKLTIRNTAHFEQTGSKTGLVDALRGVGDKVAGSLNLAFAARTPVGTFEGNLGRKVSADDLAARRSWAKGEATFACTLATRHHIGDRLAATVGTGRADAFLVALAVYRKAASMPGVRYQRRLGKTFEVEVTPADLEAARLEMSTCCDSRLRPALRLA